MDFLTDYGKLDIMLEDEISNSIERELDHVINGLERHQDFESLPNRGGSSQEIEIRNIPNRNGQVIQDGLESALRYC